MKGLARLIRVLKFQTDQKEEMMKRLISLILFLTMVVIFIGCAGPGKTAPSLDAKGNLTNEVGNATFVGETSRGVPFHEDIGIKMLANQP